MSHPPIGRPEADEHLPYHANYIDLVPGDNPLTALKHVSDEAISFYERIPEAKTFERYAEGKWSIKEVLVHLIDTERIFSYRAMRFARADETELPGFEQDDYVKNSAADTCSWEQMCRQFRHLREANILMFESFSSDAWMRKGTAAGGMVSVRALAYMIAGHELHHRAILQKRYRV